MSWWQATIDWLLARPAVLGLLAALGLTQLVKFYWPRRWRDMIRHWATVATAMALAFTVTVLAEPTKLGVAKGLVAAVFAPTIWTLTVRVLGWWNPDLRKALSGD